MDKIIAGLLPFGVYYVVEHVKKVRRLARFLQVSVIINIISLTYIAWSLYP